MVIKEFEDNFILTYNCPNYNLRDIDDTILLTFHSGEVEFGYDTSDSIAILICQGYFRGVDNGKEIWGNDGDNLNQDLDGEII